MRIIYFILISFLMFGCSGAEIARDINKVQIAMVGNKPPSSFKVANLQTMKDYVFNMDGYTVAMPSSKQKDFIYLNGWQGMTSYNKSMTLSLNNKYDHNDLLYHISVTASKVLEYGERARAIENKDQSYIVNIRKKYKYSHKTKLYYEDHGRDNYGCIVKERVTKSNNYKVSYNCVNPNINRTKYNRTTIVLTYNKPKNSTLARQYTYADLKRRAKRMLDSLYIKDGW